jgi:hypothetical protein
MKPTGDVLRKVTEPSLLKGLTDIDPSFKYTPSFETEARKTFPQTRCAIPTDLRHLLLLNLRLLFPPNPLKEPFLI